MIEIATLNRGSVLFEHAEYFIKSVYASVYKADIASIKTPIIAAINSDEEIVCAAALRDQRDGFFSEIYLPGPIEAVLSDASGSSVSREQIFEVTTLASRAPSLSVGFLTEIVCFGEGSGFSWSFFTLTSRLATLIERLGFGPICLAEAERWCVPDQERWGNYYDTAPKVYAVSRAQSDRQRSSSKRIGVHARAL